MTSFTLLSIIIFLWIPAETVIFTKNAETRTFAYNGVYNECDGKDSANYTLLGHFTRRQSCDSNSDSDRSDNLIVSDESGHKRVNKLDLVSNAIHSAGAYIHVEKLFLVTSGPLEGKYLYERVISLQLGYLRKCSSELSYSYLSSKSATLLISDNLDMQVMISATGGFDTFKKSSNTSCKGVVYVF